MTDQRKKNQIRTEDLPRSNLYEQRNLKNKTHHEMKTYQPLTCQIQPKQNSPQLHQPTSQNPTIALGSNSTQNLNHNLYNLISNREVQQQRTF